MSAAISVGTALVVGGVAAAGASIYGASQQAGAAKNAQNIAQNQYSNDVSMQQPYMQAGRQALGQLDYLTGVGTPGQGQTAASSPNGAFGSLNTPFTAQNFQQLSPAYQFQLQQGQQGVQNADAANVGALSGAAQKDLTGYSQNFANTSFNNAFNQYQTQNQNIYGRLANLANLGQSAASGTAQQGTSLAGTAASAATNYGNALASGATGVGNAASGYAQNSLLASYLNSGNQNANYGSAYGAMGSNSVNSNFGGLDQSLTPNLGSNVVPPGG